MADQVHKAPEGYRFPFPTAEDAYTYEDYREDCDHFSVCGGSCAGAFERWRAGTAPCRKQPQQAGHGLVAAGTFDHMGRLGWRGARHTDVQGASGVEGDGLTLLVRGRMTKAMISDGPQSTRQDMAQVTRGEFPAGNGFDGRGGAAGTVFPTKGDMVAGDLPSLRAISRIPRCWLLSAAIWNRSSWSC